MTFLDYWLLTRRNWVVLVLATLGGLAIAGGFSLLQPTQFSATSTAYVVAGDSSSTADALAGNTLAKDKAATYVHLVKSQQVAARIASDLGLPTTEGIAERLSGEVVRDSVLLQVTATAPTADGARSLAEAAIEATAAEVESLETINPTGKGAATTVIKVVPVRQAATPAERISPTWARNLALGPAVGLLAGYAVVIVRRALDRHVRTSAEAEELTGAGTLGVIPESPELARGVPVATDLGPAGEAMRHLRTNLRFVSVDRPPRSIVISSANPGEGKSTIAANLAVMLADAGHSTVLIDADLRRPTQAGIFELDGEVGLTHLLAGDVDLATALQPTRQPNLQVLVAGRIPPNPSELVGSERLQRLVESLADDHIVIIDAPPLLAVTDAGLLTVAGDGALLVIRAGATLKEQVGLCVDTLGKIGGTLLGCVLNRVPRNDIGSALYGYGYRGAGPGEYLYDSDAAPRRAKPAERSAARV